MGTIARLSERREHRIARFEVKIILSETVILILPSPWC